MEDLLAQLGTTSSMPAIALVVASSSEQALEVEAQEQAGSILETVGYTAPPNPQNHEVLPEEFLRQSL